MTLSWLRTSHYKYGMKFAWLRAICNRIVRNYTNFKVISFTLADHSVVQLESYNFWSVLWWCRWVLTMYISGQSLHSSVLYKQSHPSFMEHSVSSHRKHFWKAAAAVQLLTLRIVTRIVTPRWNVPADQMTRGLVIIVLDATVALTVFLLSQSWSLFPRGLSFNCE